MKKTTRVIVTAAVSLTLIVGAGFAGYAIGRQNESANTAQAVKAAECAAIEGLALTPIPPYKPHTPDCVWSYQITVGVALENDSCICG